MLVNRSSVNGSFFVAPSMQACMTGGFDSLLLQRPNLFALGDRHSAGVASGDADRNEADANIEMPRRALCIFRIVPPR